MLNLVLEHHFTPVLRMSHGKRTMASRQQRRDGAGEHYVCMDTTYKMELQNFSPTKWQKGRLCASRSGGREACLSPNRCLPAVSVPCLISCGHRRAGAWWPLFPCSHDSCPSTVSCASPVAQKWQCPRRHGPATGEPASWPP